MRISDWSSDVCSSDLQSRRKLARASLSRGSDNNVGSLGYSVNVQDSSGNTSIDGVVDYIANRFDARVSLATAGTSLGGITDDRTARLPIGTSFAFADRSEERRGGKAGVSKWSSRWAP